MKTMNRLRKHASRLITGFSAALFTAVTIGQNVSAADVVAGVQSAKTTAVNTIKPVINTVVVPIGCVVVGIFLLVAIIGCVQRHRAGEEFKEKLVTVGICIVILAVVASFPTWGWTMIGA